MSRRTSSGVFVGRQAELDRLEETLAQADTGRPSMVLVAGEAGIGKTRFVSEFVGRAEAAGARTAVGGCLDVADGGLPYAPFVEAFRALARQLDPVTAQDAFGPSADIFGGLVYDLRQPAAAPPETGPATFEDPTERLARLFDAVIGVLGRLSIDRPLVLVLEDLHWADGSTRDLIRFLARNVRDERLLVIASYRIDDLHRRHPVMPLLAELARSEHVERIDLHRFDRAELDQLVAGLLGAAPSPSVGDALLKRSDGLPFYVEELVASTTSDGMELPSSLRDILARRLVVLSPDALTVVRTAAVIGGRPSHARLAAATALDSTRLMHALHEGSDSGILIAGEDADGPVYWFRHALFREAAYDDLLPAERVRLHWEMADLLEASIRVEPEPGPATLADFALHAYLAHDLPRALEGSCRAASAFAAAVAYREAFTHAERALELWPRVSDAERRAGMDRAGLLAIAGRMAAAAGQPANATALLQEAIAALDENTDRADRAALLAELQAAAWEAEAYDIFSAAAEEAYRLGASEDASRLTFEVAINLGTERWWGGRLRESATLLETAMQIAEQIGDPDALAEAAALLAHTRADLGQGAWASELLDRFAPSVMDGARAYWRIGNELDRSITALTCGRFADSERIATAGYELAIRYGLESRVGLYFRGCLVDAMFELGRYDDADAVAKRSREGDGISHARNWMASTMGRVAIARGRLDDAHRLAVAVAADPVYGALGPAWGPAWDPFSYARVTQVDLARAEGRFNDVVPITDAFADAVPTTEAVMPTWQVLALSIGACADEATAARRRRRSTDDAVAHADRWFAVLTAIAERVRSEGGGGPWFDAAVATASAEIGRLRDRSDATAWAAVIDQWVAIEHPFQTAYTRLRLAEAILQSNGERSVAERELRSAYATATSIGAGLLLPEIEALATGARIDLGPGAAPTSPTGTGPTFEAAAGLTPRESAVLRLVADGHTNREIGDQLFISEKTVSVHVSNAMAKLDALSRYEAAATAQRLGLLDP